MPISPIVHTDSAGRPLHAILSLHTLSSLDAAGIAALQDIGIHSVGQLLHWNPVHHARTLMAIARGEIGHDVGVSKLLDAAYVDMAPSAIPGASTVTVYQIGEHIAEVLSIVFGVTTIADLSSFMPFVEAEGYLLPSDFAFQEPLSAPPELIPRAIGAVTSSVRFSSFVREVDLRDVTIHVSPSALADVPIGEVFTSSETPVIHLGYVAGYIQRWSSHGTHLGEVIHSLPLAPGESRNVTIVDWKRRQLTQRDEDTDLREQIDSVQVHKRALDEVARAVAEEHQYGKTATEANTGVTSGSFVAAGAVAGGVAGGVVGAIGGGVTGLAISSILSATDGGAAMVTGTLTGGIGGAVAGSAAGAAAGGLVFSGATALGLIESSSEGDRDVIASTLQNITQSTVQKSSAIRSLWSTIVVEGVQSEQAEIRTTNVTNYNHMHALTIQYYEVLQHYRTTLRLGSVRPLLFLPFRPLSFTFDQIHALWPYLEETARKQLPQDVIERAFADLPDAPVPPTPSLVDDRPMGPNTAVTRLWVRTTATYAGGNHNVQLTMRDGVTKHFLSYQSHLHATTSNARVDRFETDFLLVDGSLNEVLVADVRGIGVGVLPLPLGTTAGTIKVEIQYTLTDLDDQRTQVQASWYSLGVRSFPSSSGPMEDHYNWGIAETLASADAGQDQAAQQAYEQAVAVYQTTFDDRQAAREELEELFRWRRYAFTRAILQQTEPQQLTEIFEEMTLAIGENMSVPLHRIAHTIPIGTTGSNFVFELKRNRYKMPDDLAPLLDLPPGTDLAKLGVDPEPLLGYAHTLLTGFEADGRQYEATESVYLPTSGVFAEAILGRSNSAEKLDITRFFNWQDSPIPNPAPPISAADPNADRNVDQTLAVTVPSNTINLVTPATFPDPSGLTGVLQAVQNGSMFRDMSKSGELSSVIGSLATLAGEMGKASSQMTGDAAEQALKSATDIAKAVTDLAKAMQQPGASQKAKPPATLTEKGATIAQLEKLLKEAKAEAAKAKAEAEGAEDGGDGSGGSGGSTASVLPALTRIVELLAAELDALGIGGTSSTPPPPAPADPPPPPSGTIDI